MKQKGFYISNDLKEIASKVRKTDGRKLGESSPQGADKPYVGGYAALLSEGEASAQLRPEVSNSRMAEYLCGKE